MLRLRPAPDHPRSRSEHGEHAPDLVAIANCGLLTIETRAGNHATQQASFGSDFRTEHGPAAQFFDCGNHLADDRFGGELCRRKASFWGGPCRA